MTHVAFSETVTASHVCRYLVNHSNYKLNYCVDGSITHFKFPMVTKHILHFVEGLFLDISANSNSNQFVFDRPRAKGE